MSESIINNKFNRVQINAAATIYTKNGQFEKDPLTGGVVPSEVEDELAQYGLEFKQWPIPEAALEKGLQELCEALKYSMRQRGLLR